MSIRILIGDALAQLRTLADESVHCCVCSPPYWGLRCYGVEGQYGLEATPEEHVARMVEVFREVRRVLRVDGTLWLNYGDTYAAGHSDWSRWKGGQTFKEEGRTSLKTASGLKPKDLVGMPWRVAFALQQPYYTGSIKSEKDRIWLAAMLDAEGCLFIHRRKAGQSNGQGYLRQSDTFSPGIEISNTCAAVVERIMALVGKGSICTQGPEQNGRRKQTIYRWNLRTTESRDFVRELYPYLVAKRQQARILYGSPSSGREAEAAHAALKALHRTGTSHVEFPEPPSMFEPGFYLRSDIIWSKANPMPESVTDRPTKAHEYVFLLSKSARYFYDADAVREPLQESSLERGYSYRSGYHVSAKQETAQAGEVRANASFWKKPLEIPDGRNLRSVWTIATHPFPEAHFATFPPALVEPCIKAGTSERGCCAECGAPWVRVVEKEVIANGNGRENIGAGFDHGWEGNPRASLKVSTTGWRPTCAHGGEPVPCTVLDPFFGAGTTGLVADRLGRNCIGVELNSKYAAMAERRLRADCPMFTEVTRSNNVLP